MSRRKGALLKMLQKEDAMEISEVVDFHMEVSEPQCLQSAQDSNIIAPLCKLDSFERG